MERIIIRVIGKILGVFPLAVKAIIAISSALMIYIKDSKMLKSIFDDLSEICTHITITDTTTYYLSTILPIIILSLEASGVLVQNIQSKLLNFMVKRIPFICILLITFGKYFLAEITEDASWEIYAFTFVKCFILFVFIFAFHELFLHALKDSTKGNKKNKLLLSVKIFIAKKLLQIINIIIVKLFVIYKILGDSIFLKKSILKLAHLVAPFVLLIGI